MTEDQFWQIIAQSRQGAGHSQDKQEAALKELLTALEAEEVLSFHRIFTQKEFAIYSWEMWGAFYILNGGCSDDSFEYCRRGLIAAGREKYEEALRDPESLGDWAEPDELDFEGIKYAIYDAYEEKAGSGEFPEHGLEWPTIQGEVWDEDNDDLEKRFPRLWAKFGA